MVETYLQSGSIPPLEDLKDPVSKLHLVSFNTAKDRFSSPLAIESAVEHHDLGYCGIVDCVARIEDQLVLIDWKTSEKEKRTPADLYDNPLQVRTFTPDLT